MMRALFFGALLGLLVVVPPLGTAVLGAAVAVLSKPVLVAFALGLVARPYLARRRWAR